MRVLAAGAIVVSCFLILNTLTTLIAEQMRMIGTMKVLGGTRSNISKSYLLTVLIYSLLGTVLGLALSITSGYVAASQFAKIELFYLGPFSLPLDVFLIGLGSGIGAPFLAALFAILDGTRITVHEALGAYGVSSVSVSTNRWLPAVAERLTWIPQILWLGFRGIFRKRGRAIMTISALALSGITFLVVTTFTYSSNQMALQLRTNYTYDIKVRVKQDELNLDESSALSICIIFYVAAVGVAMVGILGLYNTLTNSVLERQREIGIWRSMGASNWQISRTFWIEGLSLASLAWLVGAIIGVPIAYGFDQLVSQWLFPVPFAFDAGALPHEKSFL